MKADNEFRVLSPTAILGYGFPEKSFKNGMKRKPHMIAVDAGSTDPGPFYLGSGKSFTDRELVKRDLAIMLKASVKQKIPLVIGSAGGSGALPHVKWCNSIIKEIAREEGLGFKIGIIFSDINKEAVISTLKKNKIEPLPFVHGLSETIINTSVNLVAQMGIEPIIDAFKKKCDVVLCGRCYDPAVFAALPVMEGFPKGLALHMGKILECAAIAASPGSGSDCVLGTLREDSFILETLSRDRKFTRESAAAHTLYEKSDPYRLPGPGGVINLEKCSFRELPGGRVEVRGSSFEEILPYKIKLEGARRIGCRSICVAGTRDPVMIKNIDSTIEQVRGILAKRKTPGEIFFHVYGKDAVMGNAEPVKKTLSHELGIVIETIAKTQDEADTSCSLCRSTFLHYGYKGRISTAGNLAFPFSPSDIRMGDVYEFSLYHLMEIENQDMFKLKTYNY